MKMKCGSGFILMLFVAGLLCGGCNNEQQAPASPPEPAVTNAPAATPAVSARPVTNTTPVIASPTTNTVTNSASTRVLTPEEAKEHIGQDATVRGKVFGVHVTQKGDVFINIGAAYPNQPFTAVCFQGTIPADDLKKLDGKTVSVKGQIKEYNGQVEIVLETAGQISAE